MYLQRTDTYSDGNVVVTSERDYSYTRPGTVLTDVVDGSLLQRFYFTTDGTNGTRYVGVDYQGINRNMFPMITGRGAISNGSQVYTFEYGRTLNLAPGL